MSHKAYLRFSAVFGAFVDSFFCDFFVLIFERILIKVPEASFHFLISSLKFSDTDNHLSLSLLLLCGINHKPQLLHILLCQKVNTSTVFLKRHAYHISSEFS